jgi:hypothetical protein
LNRDCRKDSSQSYTSLIDSRAAERGSPTEVKEGDARQSLGSVRSCSTSSSSDVSYTTARTTCLQSSRSSLGMAVTTDGQTSELSYPTAIATPKTTSPPAGQSSGRNFSRPLSWTPSHASSSHTSTEDLSEQRAGTQSPHLISYAESSRLQHSRHNAWTVRKRVLLDKRPPEVLAGFETKTPRIHISRTDPVVMRKTWKAQVVLLRRLDTTRQRVPVRTTAAPSPCSSCPTPVARTGAQSAPRPRTPAFRRAWKKVSRVIWRMPGPRTWFRHKTKHPLVKYPRELRRALSRTDDWPSRNSREVERALYRGGEVAAECEAVPPFQFNAARFYGSKAQVSSGDGAGESSKTGVH